MDAPVGSGGGAIGKLWRKHGGGYYALLAVGTFIYLEVANFVESVASARSIGDFVASELIGFIVETFVNTLMASVWPFVWITDMGLTATLLWACGGYLVWTFLLAIALSRREKAFKKELGI